MHLHFVCWTFPREMKPNCEVFEALRCFASSTLSIIHGLMVELDFGIPTFPLICLMCFYMFANSLLCCHLVCKVHNKPTATILFSRKWSNNKYSTSTMSECKRHFSISLWKKCEFQVSRLFLKSTKVVSLCPPRPSITTEFFDVPRWWNSKRQDFSKRRCRWLMWMVGTFLVRKDWWYFGWTLFFKSKAFFRTFCDRKVVFHGKGLPKIVFFHNWGSLLS